MQGNQPGLDLAYEFVQPSYDLLERRLEAVEGRIQLLIGFATAVVLAASTLGSAVVGKPDFASYSFVAASVITLVIALVGSITVVFGSLMLVDPGDLYKRWLEDNPADFKRQMLEAAASHFTKNRSLVNRKGQIATALAGAFVVETGFFIWWIIIQL